MVAQKVGAGKVRVSGINSTRINIYGLEADTTEEELKAAIYKGGGGEQIGVNIVNWREGYGRTFNATVVGEEVAGKNVVEKGTLKVGWTSCKIKEVIREQGKSRCYKC